MHLVCNTMAMGHDLRSGSARWGTMRRGAARDGHYVTNWTHATLAPMAPPPCALLGAEGSGGSCWRGGVGGGGAYPTPRISTEEIGICAVNG